MSRAASFAVVGLVLFALYKVAKSLRNVEESVQSVAAWSRLVAIDVAIIPQGVVASRSVAISKIMLASNPEGFALGNLEYSRRPHVTLLQMYCERDKLPLIFEAVAAVCDGIAGGALDLSVSQITAGSLFNGVQMPSFEVTPVAGLSLLHSELTSALDKYRVQDPGRQEYFYSGPGDGPINNASQDYVSNFRQAPSAAASLEKFWPHVSLGPSNTDAIGKMLKSEQLTEPIPFVAGSGTIAVYQLGDYCTCRRQLYTWGGLSSHK